MAKCSKMCFMKDYLYIFVHAHKTGGTTLNKHIYKNFKKEEILDLFYHNIKIDPYSSKYPNFSKITREYIENIPKKKRKKIKVIIGHFIPFGIHKYFEKPYRYISINRNPTKRIQSFYNYFRTHYFYEKKSKREKKVYKSFLLVNGKIPSFENWLKVKFDNSSGGIVLRSVKSYFKKLGYFKDSGSNSKKVNEILDKFYFVATTENLKEDLLYIYGLLGINKFFINQNISKKFTKNVNRKVLSDLEKKYSFDYKLYEQAIKRNKEFVSKNSGYGVYVKEVKNKRKYILYLTQIIFDFKESLHRLSALGRTKSILYSKFVDIIKRKNI